MYKIEEIDINDVKQNDKIKYNSNNHWINDICPNDYYEISKLCETNKWINNFINTYLVINLDFTDISILKKMHNISLIKNDISKLYEDEINFLINKYKHIDKYLSINGGHFVRAENVSLKTGKHGCIQYSTFAQILESILTSKIGHSPLYKTLKELRLYLIPWITINKYKEFRVFVYKNTITAISQQNLYESNEILLKTNDKINLIEKWIFLIKKYFNSNIKNVITHLNNYVYDFAILDDDTPYFIEINPFGKEYSSGSSLFHWINDEKKLYNEEGLIFFRYVI